MRQLFITILVAAVSTMTAMAETPGGQLPEAAMKTIQNCIWLIDNDMPQSAMEDLDLLAKEYPDNYVIQYERACALYRLGRYDDVVKISKRLIKHRNVTPIAFHIYGNALDNLGKTDQAINVYSKGLKRFPDAGMLYLELGVVALKQEHYNEAINKFECGIAAAPSFTSNYYRAAEMLLSSDAKAWGLVYAETSILLALHNTARQAEMAGGIRDTWLAALTFEESNDSVKAKVSLIPSRNISMSEDGQNTYLDFQGILEGCANISAQKSIETLRPFTGSISQLASLRQGIAETYADITGNLYGNSMYLLKYQQQIIEAGYWEAYNYFLFSATCPDEFAQWHEANQNKLAEFAQWIRANPLPLDNNHTVSRFRVFRHYRQLSLMEALTIYARLSGYTGTPPQTE